MISAKIIMIHSITHIISVIRDITERKEFENVLIESEEKYRSILNASPDDITITDLSGKILMISPAAKEMFGYESDFDDFIGMQLLDFLVPEDVERATLNMLEMSKDVKRSTNEYRAIRQDRSIFDVDVNSGFVYNANGQLDKIVSIVRDITKRKLIESEMKELVNQLEIERIQLNLIL
nr:PAS domain S-box protein [Tissierella sp.]